MFASIYSNTDMIEKQSINGKEAWIKVDPHPVNRKNPNTIPTEYFTAACYLNEPSGSNTGTLRKDENGEAKLFESPVAALSYARKSLEQPSNNEDEKTAQTQQEQKETD
jgi:hypothetical protein